MVIDQQNLKLVAGVLVSGQRMMKMVGGLQITSMRTYGLGIMMVRSGVISLPMQGELYIQTNNLDFQGSFHLLDCDMFR